MDNQIIVQDGRKPGILLVLVSWLFLFLLAAFSTIPFLGLVSWLVAIPVLLITFVFSIIILLNGRTVNGILLLVFTVILVPLYIAFAPLVATAVASYLMTGECEITITDSQGNLVKKRADLRHLTFSDWKAVENGTIHKRKDRHKQEKQEVVPAEKVEPGQEATPAVPPVPSEKIDKPTPESDKVIPAPASGQEKLEYV